MRQGKLCILAIDDSSADAELLRRALAGIPGGDYELLHAISLNDAQAYLAEPAVDLILLDYCLGAETGEDVLRAIRASGDLRPVVVLTGHGDEAIAASVMRAGADDYILKSQLDATLLRRAIDNARAQAVRRKFEARNRQLLEDLQLAKTTLESKNRRLAELYETAHEFVDHVSHEFRTPLTVIREFATILRDGLAGDTTPEQREYLEIVVNRVDELALLVDDMLDISRLEAGIMGLHRRECALDEIVARARITLERRAAASHASLAVDVEPDLPHVFGDPEKLGRVIINLGINALKYGGEHGQVTIRAASRAQEHEVLVSVSDNGPGIAPENVQRLFERFQQLNGSARRGIKGFGLGLSIAKELVHLCLGDITVESALGQGSTFAFTIPLAEHGELVRRFLRRCAGPPGHAAFVGLLDLRADRDAGWESLEAVDALLHRQVRRSDLLLRTDEHRWLLVTLGNERDHATLLARLRNAVELENLGRRADPLPAPTIELDNVWSSHDDWDAIVDRVKSLSRDTEPVHA